jgi:hypothetical protein
MLGIIGLGLFFVVLAVHTVVAAVATRFFRLRLDTQAGWIGYSLGLTPVILFASTLVFTGVLGIGPNLGSPIVVFLVMIILPVALGMTIDLLYVTQPEDVELPQRQ